MIRTDYTSGEKISSSDFNDAFDSIKGATPGNQLNIYNENPVCTGTPGIFQTAFPFRATTLQVYIEIPTDVNRTMSRQVRGFHYTETTPTTGTFTFNQPPGSAATGASNPYIVVDYMRSDL